LRWGVTPYFPSICDEREEFHSTYKSVGAGAVGAGTERGKKGRGAGRGRGRKRRHTVPEGVV